MILSFDKESIKKIHTFKFELTHPFPSLQLASHCHAGAGVDLQPDEGVSAEWTQDGQATLTQRQTCTRVQGEGLLYTGVQAEGILYTGVQAEGLLYSPFCEVIFVVTKLDTSYSQNAW